MNGTTWLDRTNYYETMPSHQLELALWLEADRMGTLLDALSQENLDNQREVVKNEKRWSYDNRPYGDWNERLNELLFPPDHPYHHTTIGSMEDLDAASLDDVKAFFRTHYAPNNAVLSLVGDVDPAEARAWVKRYFGRIPANPAIPALGDLSLPPTLGGERRTTRRGGRAAAARVRRRSGRRSSATTASTRSRSPRRSSPGARAAGCTIASSARTGSPRTSSCSRSGSPAARRSRPAGRPPGPGIPIERVEAALIEELERLGRELVTDDEMVRARALVETDELGALQRVEERADRLSMYATLFDDPGLIDRMLERYLAVTPEAIREVAAAVFRARQPGGRHLPARRRARTARREDGAVGRRPPRPTRSWRDRDRRRRAADAGPSPPVRVPGLRAAIACRMASRSSRCRCTAGRS